MKKLLIAVLSLIVILLPVSAQKKKQTSGKEPLFGKAMASYPIASNEHSGACFYLVGGHGGQHRHCKKEKEFLTETQQKAPSKDGAFYLSIYRIGQSCWLTNNLPVTSCQPPLAAYLVPKIRSPASPRPGTM